MARRSFGCIGEPAGRGRRGLRGTLLVLALGTTATTATAIQSVDDAELATLQQTRDALREELAAARRSQEEFRVSSTAELTALEEQREALANELLDRELARRRSATATASLTAHRDQVQAQVEVLEQALVGLQRALLEAAEQTLHLQREIPGEADRRGPLESFEGTLRAAGSGVADLGQESAALWEVLDRLHDRACHVRVETGTIWTASGRREEVELLAVGLFGFAYRTVAEGRVALALASPADASGYRWSEDLNDDVRSDLERAFEAIAAGEQPPRMPLDVSGRVTVEVAGPERGLLARLRSGGKVMIPLALVALAALLLALERAVFLFGRNRLDVAMTRRVLAAAARGDAAQAEQDCAGRGGAVAAVLLACLKRRDAGGQAMEDSIQEQLLHETPRLQRFLRGLGILAAVAPLLGLLGTVTGIIQTFGVIRSFGNDNPGLMAGGISEALVTTAAGLVIAIPILLLRGVLRARVDRLLWHAQKGAAALLNTLVYDAGGGARPRAATDRGPDA